MTTHAQAGNGLHKFPERRASNGAAPAMANGLAFFLRELRRHAATLTLSFLVLAALPIVSRWIEGGWRFWDGSRNALATALAVYVMAPLITITMAATGWSRERSQNLLDWLYARPLSDRAIFAWRTLAIALPVSVWIVLALAFGRVRWVDLAQVLAAVPGLPGPAALLVVGVGLALGAGLLASALAPSTEWAVRWSAALVVAVWLIALGIPRVVGTANVLGQTYFSSPFLALVVSVFVSSLALLFLGLAWRAMAVAPDGPGRVRGVARIGAAAVAAVVIATMAFLNVPRLAGREGRFALWMGGDAGLSFAPARGIEWRGNADYIGLSHPIVRDGEERTVLRDVYAIQHRGYQFDGPWVDPASGATMVPGLFRHGLEDWVLIDRNGGATEIQLPPQGTAGAIGWSPSGARFAWTWYPDPPASAFSDHDQRWSPSARIVVVEAGGKLRSIDAGHISPSPYSLGGAVWIDSRTLLLTHGTSTSSARGAWWTTLDVETGEVGIRQDLMWSRLTAPALDAFGGTQSQLPRLDGAPVALFVDPELLNLWQRPTDPVPPPRLVRIDAASGMLFPGPELPISTLSTSLGNAADGSLVWAVPDRMPHLPNWDGGSRTKIVRLRSLGGEPEALCSMPTGRLYGFMGQSGPWVVWDTERIAWPLGARRESVYELWGCNLETKEARVLKEWSEWAHPLATITDRGIFTTSGWVPLRG